MRAHFHEMTPVYPPDAWNESNRTPSLGLDGVAVRKMLQGAVLNGEDPVAMLRGANIEPRVYGSSDATIDGKALVRLVRQIQVALDDVYLGFLPQGCRLALEAERIMCLLHADTLGEALRVSIRFTNAMAPDAGPLLSDEAGGGLRHTCRYKTVSGLDRDTLVWIRFVWIYQFFSWLIARPLELRGVMISGPRPVQKNGFDRFALFRCPVNYNAPVDALIYDPADLAQKLAHSSRTEYNSYYANEPDWFDLQDCEPNWADRTRHAIIEFQREGHWSPSMEEVARRLNVSARRLRLDLASEGESYRNLRTNVRGELAGAYLAASNISIQEIGALLGFSEPGSFTRHFVGWAGLSPSAYRCENAANPTISAAATALLNERRGGAS